MTYTIQNEHLTVMIDRHGAELRSIKDDQGTEYFWQGDPSYWNGRSPNLFPYIGRMIQKKYEYKGEEYPMKIHGIAMYRDFEVTKHTASSITFCLQSDADSLLQYPWDYKFYIQYTLTENRLEVEMSVENKSDDTMLFAVGGHPGINVPLEPGKKFEDYRLRFSQKTVPQRILFTPDCFVEDHTQPYTMEGEDTIPLRHDLFDNDAIVLKTCAKAVTLESVSGGKSVTVSFPQMPYIGFWHMPKLDCPYVCIEPWSSLPSPKGEKTELETQADLLKLEGSSVYTNTWSITIHA